MMRKVLKRDKLLKAHQQAMLSRVGSAGFSLLKLG